MPRKYRASCSVQSSLLEITVSALLVLTPFFDLYLSLRVSPSVQAHNGTSQTQSPMAMNARQTPKSLARFVM
jgi:hypothetical protein